MGGGKKLKDLFRVDTVLHDNFLFKLHHQANFAVILFGVAFIFGMNYLNGNAIECKGGGDFDKQYCWLHGAGHIESKFHPTQVKCKADQNEMTTDKKTDERHSHYYLWVPFVLTLCLAVIKAPRVLWKEACERGMIAGIVGLGPDDKPEEKAEKIVERFRKLRRKSHKFQWGFFFCELLNIVSVIICFAMLNNLLGGKFMKYGSDFAAFSNSESPDKVNPLCNVFPSVVSCTLLTGGATGNPDQTSILCLLSNNLFNQYYFLIIWYWWLTLLVFSALGLVYRLAELLSQDVSRWVFICKMEAHGHDRTAARLVGLSSAQYFLLGRICQNLKGSQIGKVLQELEKQENRQEVPEGNVQNHAILNMEGSSKKLFLTE